MTDEDAITFIMHIDHLYTEIWDSRDEDNHLRDLTDAENRFCRDVREIRDMHLNYEGTAHKLYGDSEKYKMICVASRKLRARCLGWARQKYKEEQP